MKIKFKHIYQLGIFRDKIKLIEGELIGTYGDSYYGLGFAILCKDIIYEVHFEDIIEINGVKIKTIK